MRAGAHLLSAWQTKYPLRFVWLGLVLLALTLPSAAKLRMNGAFSALLPESAKSVRDLDVISKHVGINSTLTIAVSGEKRDRVLEYASLLGSSLERAHLDSVNRVDYQVADFVRLVEENRMLYLSLPELRKLSEGLELRLEADRRERDPFDLGLDDEIDAPTWEELEAQGRDALHREADHLPQYERGLFAHSQQNVAVIFVRTSVAHGDVRRADNLLREVERVRRSFGSEKSSQVRLDFGGDFMDATHETKALGRQMVFATLLTVALVCGAILFFFRSLRAIPLLCGFLIPPLAATGAFATLTVEYLNTSTAFLMSIVIGNGINPGVMWLSRYFEERRGGSEIERAVLASHFACVKPTFVASGAAALAYGSLIITDFRGFRDFGVIGGFGMVLCWMSAMVLLPALTVWLERLRPIRPVVARVANNPYGDAFRKLALWRPRLTLGVSLLVTSLALVATVRFLVADPFEYDFRKLTSLRAPGDRIAWVNARQSEVAPESQVGNALLMRSPHAGDVPSLEKQLGQYAEQHPGILGPVRTVQSLLPADQSEKIKILSNLREQMEPMLARAKEEDKKRLEAFLPPSDLRELTVADLPDEVVRTFREKDGTVGRLLHVEHHRSRSRWDGAYWIEWVSAARSVRTEGSREVAITGNPVIFADMLSSIRRDAPLAMFVSFGATVALIVLTLRKRHNQLVTICALLLGILWMIGGMAILGLKLHFLNLLAFPIALGNGVDYAVNVVQRFEAELAAGKEPRMAAGVSIAETGGAVVLCSLTTIFGYLSIHVSQNQALRSFAMAMAIAEWTCLLVAVVVVPAWFAIKSRRQETRSPDAPSLEAA